MLPRKCDCDLLPDVLIDFTTSSANDVGAVLSPLEWEEQASAGKRSEWLSQWGRRGSDNGGSIILSLVLETLE